MKDTTEMSLTRLCSLHEVKPDQPRQVIIEGRDPLAVFNVDGEIYATDDFCTHGKASLSDEGEQDGFKILCTWHDGAFDIRTGKVLSRPCTEALRTYKVTIRDSEIFADLD